MCRTVAAVVSLSHLYVGFAAHAEPLLRDFSAELQAQELVCLMGPNGAGKTTLLRTLLGLHQPLQGDVHIEGHELTSLSRRFLAQHISVVLPGRITAGSLTAEELVALGRLPYTSWNGRYSARDLELALEALDRVEALEFRHRRVAELSDGERQRVLIARALAQDTSLLLMDEPTAFLDITHRIQITQLLQQLAQDGKAILMTTHDLDLALHYGDRLWLWDPATQQIHVGIPEEIMLSGVLPRVFATEDIQFDPASGSLVKPEAKGPSVSIAGDTVAETWARKALTRKGFRVVSDDRGALLSVAFKEESQSWQLADSQGVSTECKDLSAVLDSLRAADRDCAPGNRRAGPGQ